MKLSARSQPVMQLLEVKRGKNPKDRGESRKGRRERQSGKYKKSLRQPVSSLVPYTQVYRRTASGIA